MKIFYLIKDFGLRPAFIKMKIFFAYKHLQILKKNIKT